MTNGILLSKEELANKLEKMYDTEYDKVNAMLHSQRNYSIITCHKLTLVALYDVIAKELTTDTTIKGTIPGEKVVCFYLNDAIKK